MRIMSVAVSAIQHQSNRLAASAERVAGVGKETAAGETSTDLVDEAAVRLEAGALTEANLAVIKSEDERLGHLLDILA
jgi:hypothetical protein